MNITEKLPHLFTKYNHFYAIAKKKIVFPSLYHVTEFCRMPKISEINIYVPMTLKAFYVKENGLHKLVFFTEAS